MPELWVYLSPHLDDAILSCGGLIADQVRAGHRVTIWTLFAGDPPTSLPPFARDLHRRWGLGHDAPRARREEDLEACRRAGAVAVHSHFPDCVYRRSPVTGQPVITENDDLFQPVHPDESGLVAEIQAVLARDLPAFDRIAVPLTLGGHMDHRIVRAAAESLGLPLLYYADYPYAVEPGSNPDQLLHGIPQATPVSAKGLRAWQHAVKVYRSQISTWWSSDQEADEAIRAYWQSGGGQQLWSASPESPARHGEEA